MTSRTVKKNRAEWLAELKRDVTKIGAKEAADIWCVTLETARCRLRQLRGPRQLPSMHDEWVRNLPAAFTLSKAAQTWNCRRNTAAYRLAILLREKRILVNRKRVVVPGKGASPCEYWKVIA